VAVLQDNVRRYVRHNFTHHSFAIHASNKLLNFSTTDLVSVEGTYGTIAMAVEGTDGTFAIGNGIATLAGFDCGTHFLHGTFSGSVVKES